MYLAAAGAGGGPPPPHRPNRGPPSKPGGLTPKKDKRQDRRTAETEQAGQETPNRPEHPLRKFVNSGQMQRWTDKEKLALFDMLVEQGANIQPPPPSAAQRMPAEFLVNKNDRAAVSLHLTHLLRGLVSMHVSLFFLPCISSFLFLYTVANVGDAARPPFRARDPQYRRPQPACRAATDRESEGRHHNTRTGGAGLAASRHAIRRPHG